MGSEREGFRNGFMYGGSFAAGFRFGGIPLLAMTAYIPAACIAPALEPAAATEGDTGAPTTAGATGGGGGGGCACASAGCAATSPSSSSSAASSPSPSPLPGEGLRGRLSEALGGGRSEGSCEVRIRNFALREAP